MSVSESTQQIAIGPNKRCAVKPRGSTDSFYWSHKEQLWKTQPRPVYTSQRENGLLDCFSWSVVKLGFICIL